jgi:hypothetical protein
MQVDTRKKRTAKAMEVRGITDFIIETYSPQNKPIVLMWREIMAAYTRKNWADAPLSVWTRDSSAVHQHCKTYCPEVVKELESQYRLTVVKVNRHVRQMVAHGGNPKVDKVNPDPSKTTKLEPSQWRKCIPHPRAMAFGIVCFPRDQFADHPLVIAKLGRRVMAAANGFRNSIGNIDTANGLGVLSDDSRESIKAKVIPVVRQAIEESHPLFAPKPLSIEGTG